MQVTAFETYIPLIQMGKQVNIFFFFLGGGGGGW